MRILGVDPGLEGGLAIVEDGALVWAAKIPWEAELITPVGGVRGKGVHRLQGIFNLIPFPVDAAWIEHPLEAVTDHKGQLRPGNPLTFAHFGMIVEELSGSSFPADVRCVYPGGASQPHSWESWAFAGLKRQIQTDAYRSIGLPAEGLKDETLWFSRLAALIYFGEEAVRRWCIPAGSRVLHDGLTDAALIALFGWRKSDGMLPFAEKIVGAKWCDLKLKAAWPEFFQARAPLAPSTSDVPFEEAE